MVFVFWDPSWWRRASFADLQNQPLGGWRSVVSVADTALGRKGDSHISDYGTNKPSPFFFHTLCVCVRPIDLGAGLQAFRREEYTLRISRGHKRRGPHRSFFVIFCIAPPFPLQCSPFTSFYYQNTLSADYNSSNKCWFATPV